MRENKKNRDVQKLTLFIVAGLVLLLGGAYAWLTVTVSGNTDNSVVIGNLELNLTDGREINLENALPISDQEGMALDPYHFILKNDGNIDSEFKVYLDDDLENISEDEKRMDERFVKYSLVTRGISSGAKLLTDITEREIYSGTLKPNESQEFDLRVWLDIDATNEAMNTIFAGKIRVEASQIKE